MLSEKLLDIESSAGTSACSHHSLSIAGIGDIACGIDALDTCGLGVAFELNVALVVELAGL